MMEGHVVSDNGLLSLISRLAFAVTGSLQPMPTWLYPSQRLKVSSHLSTAHRRHREIVSNITGRRGLLKGGVSPSVSPTVHVPNRT